MENFVNMLLGCTISMSIISLLVYGFKFLLSKRYNAKSFYFTWIIIMAGFMVPYRPTFGFTKFQINIPGKVSALSTINNNAFNSSVIEESSKMAYRITKTSIYQVIFAIWLTGFLLFIIYQALKHWKFTRLVGRWSQDIQEERTISLLENLCCEMKIVTPIKCRKCDFISTPMLIHFVKPIILLPDKQLTISKLTVVLKHELVHFKRKDLWIKALVVVTRAMHWFNPLIHFLSKEISLQCELSCDMEVVEGLDFDTRLSYCQTIISMGGGQKEFHTPLVTNFNGGKNMKKRLLGIMNPSKRKLSLVLMCGVCILTLGTGIAYASGIADHPIASKDNSSVSENEITVQDNSDKVNTSAETASSKMSMVPTTSMDESAEEADRLAREKAIAVALEEARLAEEAAVAENVAETPELVPTTSLEEPAEEAIRLAMEEEIAVALEEARFAEEARLAEEAAVAENVAETPKRESTTSLEELVEKQ